ncbi:MAG: eCIS core domain-containing protein [Flavobacteriales bacterium]
MYTHAAKSKESGRRSAAENTAQKKNRKTVSGISGTEISAATKQENDTGLPDNLKAGIEQLSGYSMDDVKVHRNSAAPAQLQAHAYAQGTDIHLAPGQEKHLPHEAWHVVQQKQGRVTPTMQMKGRFSINTDNNLEKEADTMGSRALAMNVPFAQNAAGKKQASSPGKTMQAMGWDEIWNMAQGFDISYTMIAITMAAVGIGVLYNLLKNSKGKEDAQKKIRKISTDASTPAFKEPATTDELNNCIRTRSYPPDIITLGNKKDWVRRMAAKLGVKEKQRQKYIDRVDEAEGITSSGASSSTLYAAPVKEKFVPSVVKTKVKTKGEPGIGAGEEEQAPVRPPFEFNNCDTWDIGEIEYPPHFPANLQVQPNYIQALREGMLTNNSVAMSATVGVRYHAHANGGSGGIAFRYVRTPGTSQVTPVIYDFAATRGGKSGNEYQWRNHAASNTAP